MKFGGTDQCPVLMGFTIKGEAKLIYCGQWTCKRCAKKLSRKWAIRVKLHISANMSDTDDKWYMLTLTLGSKYTDVPKAYSALKKLWNRLRMSIGREKGGEWQYCAFVEGQPKRASMPHFHIVMNYAPKGCFGKRGVITEHATHDYAKKRGWGYEAKLQSVNDDGAAWYIAKYTSKGSGVVPKGFRRVRTYHGWTKLPIDPNRRLIVRGPKETLEDYLIRVQDISGTPLDDLYKRFAEVKQQLDNLRED